MKALRIDINKILKNDPVECSRGAPLGQRNWRDSDPKVPLYLQRVRWVDGDYSPDGTYWGHDDHEDMYLAFNGPQDPEHAPGFGTRVWVRAWDRASAMREVRRQYPDVTFVRGRSA